MKRILIVDHEPHALDQIRLMLASEHTRCQIRTAVDTQTAYEALNTEFFDLVLAEVTLPGTDGITFLRKVRDEHPSSARLLLAGSGQMHLAQRAGSVAYRVVAKPPQANDLIETIDRIFLLQDTISSPEVRSAMGAIGTLPSLSNAYTALNLAVRDPDSSMAEIAAIIERDMAMTAKVLQLVNSGFFGLAQKITNVRTAVSFLGTETIKNLALASETFRLFVPGAGINRSFLETVHAHAYRTATVVSALPLVAREREIAVVAALLQDIGELMLASRMPEVFYAAMTLAAQRKCPDYVAEEIVIGTTHAEIGAYLLGLWGIDAQTVEAVAHHHRPTRIPHRGLDGSAAVYLASLIATELEVHPQDHQGKELKPDDRDNLDALGMTAQYPILRARVATLR